jgi:predicted nucleotidyltransferase
MRNQVLTELELRERFAIQVLVERLTQAFPDQILATTLFGSKARGDDSAESDIDILVITTSKDWQVARKLRQIGARVSLEQDVLFNIHVVDHIQWAEMERAQSTYWRNVRQDGIELLPQAA